MPVSPSDIPWLMQRHGAEAGVWLMTVNGPDVGGVRRYARYSNPITSRGNVYQAGWFDFEEPGDTDELPVATLSLPNVDREIGLLLEENNDPVTATFELVRIGPPNTVVMAFRALSLRTATTDPLTVTGTLSAARYDDEPYGPLMISPAHFPGLFL
jgi:hypothetical protein